MARFARPNAGVIGLGLIGSRVATNLRKAGHQVWVWNRTPQPQPNFLASAAEVAESAKHIQIFVSDGPALLEVVTAMSPALGPEHIIINHTTVSPKETLAAAEVVHGRHAKYLDAPFTGSRDAAEAGQIVFYIGGEAAVLEKVRSQLEVNARAIVPMGEIGQAAAVKIATNLIVAVTVGAYAEALCLLEKSGVPLYKLGEALSDHVARSGLTDMKIPGMIAGSFDPRFSLKHMFKDVQIALSMAEEFGVELPEATSFAGTAMAGLQAGWGDLDFSSVAGHYGFSNADNEIPDGIFAAPAAPAATNGEADSSGKKKRLPIFGRK